MATGEGEWSGSRLHWAGCFQVLRYVIDIGVALLFFALIPLIPPNHLFFCSMKATNRGTAEASLTAFIGALHPDTNICPAVPATRECLSGPGYSARRMHPPVDERHMCQYTQHPA